MAQRGPDVSESSQIAIVDVATGDRAGSSPASDSVDVGARWLPDGSLLFVSDADGWFQVVRLTADGHDRIVADRRRARARRARRRSRLRRRCRRPTAAASSMSRSTTGSRTCSSASSPPAAAPKRGPRPAARRRRGPSRRPRPAAGSIRGTASGGRSAGWPTAPGSRRSASARRRRRTCGCCPFPASPPTMRGRARSPIRCRPSLRAALSPARVPTAERIVVKARDGLRVEGTLWRPPNGDGQARRAQGADRRHPARRPDRPVVPRVLPVQAAARGRRLRGLRRRFPRLDRLRPGVPHRQRRRVGSRRRPRPRRCRPLGRRAALVGRPAGHLRQLVRRLPGPVRARRRAVAVARRRRPVRRLGDRRELPPWRPARPARPPQDDGLARRPGPLPELPPRLARSTAPSGSRRRC